MLTCLIFTSSYHITDLLSSTFFLLSKLLILFQKVVDDLYNFKDYYFENNPLDAAVNLYSDLKKELNKTVAELQSHEGA